MKRLAYNAIWIVPTFLLLSCSGERAQTQMAGDESEAAGQSEMEMAAGTYAIHVTNPMPHDMIVYASGPDDEMELGLVSANGSAEFEITEPAALDVELRATDANQTHSVRGTVTLSAKESVTWTIAAN